MLLLWDLILSPALGRWAGARLIRKRIKLCVLDNRPSEWARTVAKTSSRLKELRPISISTSHIYTTTAAIAASKPTLPSRAARTNSGCVPATEKKNWKGDAEGKLKPTFWDTLW